MYCKHCGKEVSDNAVICIHCGCSISKTSTDVSLSGESKSGLGALLGILLGLIGLIIGLLMFPSGSEERRTFIKGWGIAFGISMGVVLLFYIICIAIIGVSLF